MKLMLFRLHAVQMLPFCVEFVSPLPGRSPCVE